MLKRINAIHCGVMDFCTFVRENGNNVTGLYPFPCKRCYNIGTRLSLDDIYAHLTSNGIMLLYTVWYLHCEM